MTETKYKQKIINRQLEKGIQLDGKREIDRKLNGARKIDGKP